MASLTDPLTGELATDDTRKSNIMNDFFVKQTHIDDANHVLPHVSVTEN